MKAYSNVVFLLLVLFIQTSQLCYCKNSTSACNERERQALLTFRSSFMTMSGLPPPLASWEGNDCCQWKGVGCHGVTGPVIKLDLRSTSCNSGDCMLVAEVINPSLVELEHLNHLDLSGIDFHPTFMSPIPAFLGSMKQLRYLNLSYCYFFGRIPHHLGNLSNLHVLDVSYNFELYDDDMGWVSKLSSLKHLAMGGVSLEKTFNLFQVLYMLPSLSQADFTSCGITNHHFDPHGPVNSTFHSNVEVLNLAWNYLDGSIHDAFQNMSSINDLDLSWNSFSSIPRWFGNLHSLAHLHLRNNSLQGPIPNAFQNMSSSITDLHLDGNFISSVPHWLDNLHSLTHLYLAQNSLKGPIPDVFQNMSSIRVLDLSLNALSSIPHWSSNLQSLVLLNLSMNNFNGIEVSIASILRSTCSLQSFDLSRNMNGKGGSPISFGTSNLSGCKRYDLEDLFLQESSITGSLPSWLGDMKSLKRLYLEDNLIQGQIPSSLGQLSSLRELHLSKNHLTGTIPIDIGALSNLVILDLSENRLTGGIPVDIAALSNLVKLDLSKNNLTGYIPVDIGALSNLVKLDLSKNNLTGDIPVDIGSLSNLVKLNLSENRLTGDIPIDGRSLSTLVELDLSNNQLKGVIPESVGQLTNLRVLKISNNQISGTIPYNFGVQTYMKELILKNNLFEGSIPESLCHLDRIIVLDLSDNRLSGKIPDCWRNNEEGFSIINLSSNKLSGTISSSFGKISHVSWLNLSNNSLHGEISQVLRNIQEVQILDLGGNRFSGMIPPEIGQSRAFQMLQILRLSHNLLSGGIPSSLCQLPLQILDLAGNKLSGSIPLCVSNLGGMIKQSTRDKNATDFVAPAVAPSLNQLAPIFIELSPALPPPTEQWEKEDLKQVLKGLELGYTTNLKYLINIDLSDNDLTGLIPEGLTSLSGLIGLNLSHNKLSGGIPSKIGKMKSLESVDLSSNQLYGSIPISMSTLTSLEFLNLSNNNFSGLIPKGNQFSTFDPSSFVGNPYLCGDPLSNPCGSDHGTKAGSEIKSDNDEGKEKVLFYFVIAVGFIIGFWGVIGILVLKRRWRHALFQYVEDFVDTMYVEIVIRVARFKRMINTNQLHQ